MRTDMWTNTKKQSFRQQLMTILAAMLAVTMVLFTIAFQSVKGIITRQYSNSAEQSVKAAADILTYTLQDIENLSSSILFNHELLDSFKNQDQDQFISRLNSYFNSSFYIEGIYTMSDSDYWYVGANVQNGTANFPRKDLEDTNGEIIWIPTRELNIQILSGRIPQNYFAMGRKIVDVNSLKTLGYMSIEIDERVLQEAYGNLKEDGSQIFIFDESGAMISASNHTFDTTYAANHSYVNYILGKNHAGSTKYEEDGQDYVAIYAPVNQSHWRIIKTIPQDMLYADVNQLQMYIMIGSVIFFLIMLGLAFLYSRQLTKPITRMIRQMKKVEDGNLQVRVDTNINNELGNLGESFNHMIKRIHILMDEVVTAERHKNEMELEVLHAQINPHFLYNTLNTIRWMAKIKGEESISSALVALVKLLRVSISLGKNLIPLKEEIDYIENYLLIQRLRFNQRFEIQYDILPIHKDVLIPKLILQPIVENALIYGIDELEDDIRDIKKILFIHVYTEESEHGIRIIVEDNGPGITSEVLANIFKQEKNIEKFSTVGLNNINQRIKMYFKDDFGLSIYSDTNTGTRVTIEVPKFTKI